MPALSEFARINPRLEFALDDDDPISFLGMADVSEEGTTTRGLPRLYSEVKKGYTAFADGDLLVAKITPCFENGKIAQASLSSQHGFGSTEFHVVRPDTARADPRFVLHALRSPAVRAAGESRMTGSAGQRRVPKEFLESLEIPLPPLPEQRRIASILDSVSDLREKRRRSVEDEQRVADAALGTLLAARDDARPTTLGEIAEIQTGPFGSLLHKEDYISGGIPLVNPTHINDGRINSDPDLSVTDEKFIELQNYALREGDVVLGRRGEMGRAAEVTSAYGRLLCGTGSLIVRPRQNAVLPAILAGILRSAEVRDKLERRAQGVTMLNLNQSIVGDLEVTLAPMHAQLRYGELKERLSESRDLRLRHLAKLDELFASLQYRAFRGEL